MEIYVNGEKLEVTLEEEKIFKEIWEQLMQYFTKQNIAILGIKINGKEVSPKDIVSYLDEPIENIEKVELVATSYADLITHSIKVIPNFKELLKDNLKSVISAAEEGEDELFINKVEEFLQNLERLAHLLSNIVKITTLSSFEQKQEILSRVNKVGDAVGVLQEQLHNPIKNNDIVLLRDFVLYELEKELDKVIAAINDIK